MEVGFIEFASMAGISKANLSTYVKRGKAIRLPNGNFETENEYNVLFLEKRNKNSGFDNSREFIKEGNEREQISELQKQKREAKQKFNDVGGEVGASTGQSITQIEKAIKLLTANKLKRDVEVLDIKIEKLKGTVIPSDLVKLVFAQQFKSTAIAFKNGAEKFIMRLTKEVGLSREEGNKIRAEFIEIINEAVTDSIVESKKQIEQIVEDFTETRSKGEKK